MSLLKRCRLSSLGFLKHASIRRFHGEHHWMKGPFDAPITNNSSPMINGTRQFSSSGVRSSSCTVNLSPVKGLKVTSAENVSTIALDRPDKLNALTLDMIKGITSALRATDEDSSTSVTVMQASGPFFSAGNDLNNFAAFPTATKEEVARISKESGKVLDDYVQAFIDHRKPLICLLNGPAVGIAVTVLPLFDYVIASDKTTLHAPFATLSQSAEGASSYTFPLIMGQLKAAEMLIFGKKIKASEALERGLVTEVVPHSDFNSLSRARLSSLSQLPPESLRVNKQLLRSIHKDALTKANQLECSTIVDRWQSPECISAISFFLSSRSK